jgi:Uma2 family endonuclease
MKARARGRATYADLLRAPENLVAELVDGELYTWPRPAGPHNRFASAVGMDVGTPYDRGGGGGPGGWWIVFEPEVHLADDVVVPDLAGWRRERMPQIPRDHRYTVVPDWICEVLSPSTGRFDRATKLPLYAAHGVRYAWLADPLERTVEILRLENGRWSIVHVFSGNDILVAEPFELVEIDLASIWGDEPPPAPVQSPAS